MVLLGYDPVLGVGVVNIEARLEPVLHWERKFINSRFPSLALTIDASAGGGAIGVLQRNAMENLAVCQGRCDVFSNHGF